jgi:hypothetical protein
MSFIKETCLQDQQVLSVLLWISLLCFRQIPCLGKNALVWCKTSFYCDFKDILARYFLYFFHLIFKTVSYCEMHNHSGCVMICLSYLPCVDLQCNLGLLTHLRWYTGCPYQCRFLRKYKQFRITPLNSLNYNANIWKINTQTLFCAHLSH